MLSIDQHIFNLNDQARRDYERLHDAYVDYITTLPHNGQQRQTAADNLTAAEHLYDLHTGVQDQNLYRHIQEIVTLLGA